MPSISNLVDGCCRPAGDQEQEGGRQERRCRAPHASIGLFSRASRLSNAETVQSAPRAGGARARLALPLPGDPTMIATPGMSAD